MTTAEALEVLDIPWPRMRKLHCPAHSDSGASLHLYEDSFYCFSCGRNGDSFGLIALMSDRPISEVLRQYQKGDRSFQKATVEAAMSPYDQKMQRFRAIGDVAFHCLRNRDLPETQGRIADLLAEALVSTRQDDVSPYDAEKIFRRLERQIEFVLIAAGVDESNS